MVHLALRSRFFQDHPHKFALRLAFLGIDRLHVDVGRDLHTGVAQKFLHNLRTLPVGIEECSEGVPECMLENTPRWDRSITAAAWFCSRPQSLTVCAAAHHLAGELFDINNETVILYDSIIAHWAN